MFRNNKDYKRKLRFMGWPVWLVIFAIIIFMYLYKSGNPFNQTKAQNYYGNQSGQVSKAVVDKTPTCFSDAACNKQQYPLLTNSKGIVTVKTTVTTTSVDTSNRYENQQDCFGLDGC
jgi:hypothetical protein